MPDRRREQGVNVDLLAKFKTQGQAWLDWRAKADASSPWGADTEAAAALLRKMDGKIHEFFLMCELRRQEAPADAALRLTDEQFRALWAKDAPDIEAHLVGAIAPPNPQGVLDLDGPLNGLFRDDLAALRKVIDRAPSAPRRASSPARRGAACSTCSPSTTPGSRRRCRELRPRQRRQGEAFLGSPLPGRVTHFIELDKAAAASSPPSTTSEKLLLYVRWLVDLVDNFVNLSAGLLTPRARPRRGVGSRW
ncbi:MAG: hypothetical protein U0325_31775 [Polyangiales bacterium]